MVSQHVYTQLVYTTRYLTLCTWLWCPYTCVVPMNLSAALYLSGVNVNVTHTRILRGDKR